MVQFYGQILRGSCWVCFVLWDWQGPELFRKWVGDSEKEVSNVFRKARQVSPMCDDKRIKEFDWWIEKSALVFVKVLDCLLCRVPIQSQISMVRIHMATSFDFRCRTGIWYLNKSDVRFHASCRSLGIYIVLEAALLFEHAPEKTSFMCGGRKDMYMNWFADS